MQKKDVCCTTSVMSHEGKVATSRAYREVFDINNLPNVYSGFTYFRYTQLSIDFFLLMRDIFQNWSIFRDEMLKSCRHARPNTDEVYAIAVKILGEENFFLPINIPTFVHMKGSMIRLGMSADWTKHYYSQMDGLTITAGFNRQMYPFHYVQKHFATEELISHYERILGST